MDRAGKIYRYMLFSILLLSLLLIGFLGYRIKKMIPDQILLRKGQTEELNIGIPVSAAVSLLFSAAGRGKPLFISRNTALQMVGYR